MKKKTVVLAAGALLLVGGVAAIAAVGDRGGWHGGGHMRGMGAGERTLTKDEADARARERFARLDKNSDGAIDAAEIEAALTARMGERQQSGSQRRARMLHRFDENRDGKVTKDEFTSYLKKRFALADLDNNGKITDEDLPPMMRGRKALAGEGAPMMGPMMRQDRGRRGGDEAGGLAWLRGADANKDGVVTLDEALAKGLERFAQLDRNKDGAIDQADFDAMRKEMVDYRVKRFIHSYGADKDGKVTREQFLKAAAERFALADVDNNGRITRDEMGMGGRRGRGPERDGPRGFQEGPRRGPGPDGMMGPGGSVGPGGMGGMGPGGQGRN